MDITLYLGEVRSLERFLHVSKDLLKPYSSQWNITAITAIKNTDAAVFLYRI